MAQAKKYHILDVAKHNTDNDAWIIIENKVYDITKFESHPGGHGVLLRNAGSDRTEQFRAVSHPESAFEQMKQFHIGEANGDPQSVGRQATLSNVVLGVFCSLTLYLIKRAS